MNNAIELKEVALRPNGVKTTYTVVTGTTMAVMGPASSGKTQILQAIGGLCPLANGGVRLVGTALYLDHVDYPRRATPQAICKKAMGSPNPTLLTRVLSAVNLWDVRLKLYGELSGSQQVAMRLLPSLVSENDVLLIDGLLDGLDPWTITSAIDWIVERSRHGQTWIIATQLPTIAMQLDELMLLKQGSIHYVGKISEFLSGQEPITIEVQTSNTPAIRALVEPFAIDIEEKPHSVRFRAHRGQSLAARLLLEGYGDVRVITIKQPSFEDLLRSAL